MPTRNRAALLPWAIRSALEQRFDDLEVVVSDNASSDRTPQLIEEFRHPKLRHVRTPRMLTMPESWDFALSHAQGEYVTILCDDDALLPGCCARADAELRQRPVDAVYWRRSAYCFDDFYQSERRNTVKLRSLTRTVRLEPTRPLLDSWYRTCLYQRHAPMLYNGFIRRARLEAIRERVGLFCIGPAPDVGASITMLAHVSEMLLIDEVLALAGSGSLSIGASQHVGFEGGAAEAFVKEFDGKIFTHVPFKVNMIATTVADTLATAKLLMPDVLAGFEIDWDSFFKECYCELMQRRRRGIDVDRSLAQLEALMRERSHWLPLEARLLDAGREWRAWRKSTRKRIGRLLGRPVRSRFLRGEEAGFSNILECARALERSAGGP